MGQVNMLGKVLGVTAVAYSLSFFTALVIMVIANILLKSIVLPGAPILFHVLLVIPTSIAAFAELLRFIQLRLGLCESRILNFVIFAPLFADLYGVGRMVGSSFDISWIPVGILFAISVFLLAVTAYLTKHLSKERIVTTIN